MGMGDRAVDAMIEQYVEERGPYRSASAPRPERRVKTTQRSRRFVEPKPTDWGAVAAIIFGVLMVAGMISFISYEEGNNAGWHQSRKSLEEYYQSKLKGAQDDADQRYQRGLDAGKRIYGCKY